MILNVEPSEPQSLPALQQSTPDRAYRWLQRHARAVELLLLLAILILAAVLRAYHLDYKSLWLDEVTYVRSAQLGPLFGPYGFASISHPPGYLFLMRLMGSLGREEWLLRLPAMLASVAGVAALWLLGRTLLGRAIGLVAAFLLALSPLHVDYAQEAHSYALFGTLSILLLWSLARAARRELQPGPDAARTRSGRSRRRGLSGLVGTWWPFVLVAVLDLYVHYYAIAPVGISLLIFPLLLVAVAGPFSTLWREAQHRRAMLHLVAALVVVGLLFLPQLVSQLSGSAAVAAQRAEAIDAGSLSSEFGLTPAIFLDTFLAFMTNRSPWNADPLFVLATTALWLVGTVWLLWRRTATGLALLLWTLLPMPLIAWFASQTGFSFAPRRLIFVLPVFLLVVAVGMTTVARLAGQLTAKVLPQRAVWSRLAAAAALLLLLLIFAKGSADPLNATYRRPKQDWRTLAHLLETAPQPGDAVVILPSASAPLDWYYKNPGARHSADGLEEKLEGFCRGGGVVYVAAASTGRQPSAADARYLVSSFIEIPLKEVSLYYRNCRAGQSAADGAEALMQQAIDPYLSLNVTRAALKTLREQALTAQPEPTLAVMPTPPPGQPTVTPDVPQPESTATEGPLPTATPPPPAVVGEDLAAFFLGRSTAQPDDSLAQLQLAALLAQEGDLESALSSFARAVELDPANGLAYALVGAEPLQRWSGGGGTAGAATGAGADCRRPWPASHECHHQRRARGHSRC